MPQSSELLRLPPEYRASGNFAVRREVSRIMRAGGLTTVCEEARCPNINECFAHKTASFMIMGDRCTRRCHFCAVNTKKPLALDPNEPSAVAKAALKMGLNYVVITSVDRDELVDYGAAHFVQVVNEVKRQIPHAKIELLTPDFHGEPALLDQVLASAIDVFGHNIETVERLYKKVRPQSNWATTTKVLSHIAKHGRVTAKTGMMVGLGEDDHEVLDNLSMLYSLGVKIVTIGQYLRPSLKHWPVDRYVGPDSYHSFISFGRKLGLTVFASAMMRSSYHAEEAHHRSIVG